MSITTKQGDKGIASLGDGQSVEKHDPRLELLGDLDELSSWLGMVKHNLSPNLRKVVHSTQEMILRLSGEIAMNTQDTGKPLTENDVHVVERIITELEESFQWRGLIIPGGTRASGEVDVCRTIARRAERRFSRIKDQHPTSQGLIFLNRLSDLLFLVARGLEKPSVASR